MALRYVEYKRRQWVLRFRDPWPGKQRVRSFFTEAEAKAFEGVGNARDSRGAFGVVYGNP